MCWGGEICSVVRYWATQRLSPSTDTTAGCYSKSKNEQPIYVITKAECGMRDFPVLADGQEGKLF